MSGWPTWPGGPWRLLGIGLLAIPFLPLPWYFGDLQGASGLVGPGEWAFGLLIFVLVAWLLLVFAGERSGPVGTWHEMLDRGGDWTWLVGGLIVLAVLLVAVSWAAYHRSPHLIDSVVQLFQAEIFASGALKAPAPPGDGFFTVQNMILDADGWYSQYPPGHAALLAVGVLVGAPWAVPVSLSLGAAGAIFLAVRRMYGQRCGRLTLALLVLCPFFWFMGAGFMNHVSSLACVAFFLYAFVRWEDEGRPGWAAAAGAALGAAALSRPLTAVAVAVPFAGFALADRRRGHLLPAAAGFAAVGALYLVYNAQVTGAPLVPGYLELWGSSHGLGFHATPWGGEHTPAAGLRNELLDLSLLNVFLFEWPVPALLPVGAAFALGWTADRWDRRLLLAFLAIPAAYFFYWHRDSFRGPRFLYTGLVFLVPLTARSILAAMEQLRGRSFQIGEFFRPVDAGRWAGLFLLLCAGYAALYAAPRRFGVYASSTPSMKTDITEEARRAGITEGLLFVKVSWGNRIMARLRGEGVSAGLVERVYRRAPHCRLDSVLRTAAEAGQAEDALARELRRATVDPSRLIETSRLNGDPTLRLLESGQLDERCRDELRYDRQGGYTNYAPHLVANRPGLEGPFVVARDLRGRNGRLAGRFPDLPAYVYNGSEFRRPENRATRGPAPSARSRSRTSDSPEEP